MTAWTAPTTSGGANSSVERNNVYGIEPRVYLQDGREVNDATGKPKIDPATLVIGTVAIAIVAVAVRGSRRGGGGGCFAGRDMRARGR